MNEKLIRRAAVKYRNWMVAESQQLAPAYKERILGHLNMITDRSNQMRTWIERFFRGTTQRIQIDPFNSEVRYKGIVNPGVYKDIVTEMIPDLRKNITLHLEATGSMLKAAVKNTPITPLSLREAIEEIRIVSKTWSKVKFRANTLSVLITDVTLCDEEEVNLGSFWVNLDLTNPIEGLDIESVDEIQSEGGYYHPHVKHDNLCSGDGDLPMNDAICQGRLEDFFRVVEAILRTYNPESPHEELTEWYNPHHEGEFYCDRCEEWRDDDVSCWCDGCNTQYCDCCDVGGGCCTKCEEWRCSECSTTCNDCGGVVCKKCDNCDNFCENCKLDFCSSCMVTCVSCQFSYCASCTQSCASCGETACDECKVECSNCGDDCCPDCVDKNCEDCEDSICKSCQGTCDDCGTSMCQSCEEEHNCLLAEVNDG